MACDDAVIQCLMQCYLMVFEHVVLLVQLCDIGPKQIWRLIQNYIKNIFFKFTLDAFSSQCDIPNFRTPVAIYCHCHKV